MTRLDPFLIVWCAFVVVLVIANVELAFRDVARGQSRLVAGRGDFIKRSEQPSAFWIAIAGKLLTIPVGVLMIWFVLAVAPR